MQFIIFKDFICIIPEFFIAVQICMFLIFGSYLSGYCFYYFNKVLVLRKLSFWLCVILLVQVSVLLVNNPYCFFVCFFGCLITDFSTVFSKLVVVVFCFVIIFVTYTYNKKQGLNFFEYYVLILLGCFSLILILSAYDLLGFYIALELQALVFYILVSIKRSSAFSTEF